MTSTPEPDLDTLAAELGLVREAGLEPLDVEERLAKLTQLVGLGVVAHRTKTDTSLGRANAVCQVVREALDLLTSDEPPHAPDQALAHTTQALMLFRVHPKTAGLSPAAAREAAQSASGLQDRQFRRRQEGRLLRLVAQAVLDVDRADDLHQWGRALRMGADVPQTVAMYWLYLFRDHYFRMETSAFAFQFDYATALSQLRHEQESWKLYLATAVYWNVEFSYLRHRFFRDHGPLWFAPTDEGCTKLNDAVERIEYHDPFPDDFMARLRRIYGGMPDPDHDDFTRRLQEAGLADFTMGKAEAWLRRCECPLEEDQVKHIDGCDIQLVLANCDTFAETVETEFEHIQNWYRTPRFAVDTAISERILNYRTPANERPGATDEPLASEK